MSVRTVNVSLSSTPRQKTNVEPSISGLAIFAILLLLGVSYAFNSMDRLVFAALLVPISKDYSLTLSQGGFLSTSFAIFIAVFGGFSGWCMARFGRKATMVGGLVVFSIFTLVTPLAGGFVSMAAYRSFTGAGEAFQIGALWAIVGAFFGSRRGAAMGILNALFGLGAFVGPMWGTRLAENFGSWRIPFYVYGIGGLVLAFALIVFVPNSFAGAVDSETVAGQPDGQGKAGSTGLFNRNCILLALAFGLTGYSYFGFSSLYPTYLRHELGFTMVDAGAAFGMYGIGAMFAVICGWACDKLKRAGHLVVLALLPIDGYLLFHGAWSFSVHAVLSLVCGLLVSGYLYPRFVAVVQRSVPPEHVGYAMSLLIPMFYVPGLFAGLVFGWLVGLVGWGLASTISVALPAALAFVITCFYDPRRVRGEA